VHEGEKGAGLDAMHGHQARKRRPVIDIELLLHALGLDGVDAQQVHDEGAHLLVDPREEVAGGRVERVVEIEDPMFDLQKGGRRQPGFIGGVGRAFDHA